MVENDQFVQSKSKLDLERNARQWRFVFHCEDRYAPDISRILEHGLPLIDPEFMLEVCEYKEMPDCEGRSTSNPPRIILREDIYEKMCNWDGRSRMTAAHELGHYLLHSSKKPLNRMNAPNVVQLYRNNKSMSAEWQANYWASCFLMPKDIVTEFSTPLDLSEFCKTSFQAAEIRMKELGLLKKKVRETPDFVKQYLIDAGRWRGEE